MTAAVRFNREVMSPMGRLLSLMRARLWLTDARVSVNLAHIRHAHGSVDAPVSLRGAPTWLTGARTRHVDAVMWHVDAVVRQRDAGTWHVDAVTRLVDAWTRQKGAWTWHDGASSRHAPARFCVTRVRLTQTSACMCGKDVR